MFQRILYVGAGAHLEPITHFPQSRVVMVDREGKEKLCRRKDEWREEWFRSDRLTYFFDTDIPDHIDRIFHKKFDPFDPFDTLMVSGHHPSIAVRPLLTTPFHFIGYSRTWFPRDLVDMNSGEDGDPGTILDVIVNRGDNQNEDVASYTYVDISNGAAVTFSSYAQFYAHYCARKNE